MVEKTTSNICIRALSLFQPDLSDFSKQHYVFSYDIEIINLSDHPVQLISRHWEVTDTRLHKQVVDGKGVVGKMPIILVDNSYNYTSAVSIQSEIGVMSGHYTMKNLVTNKEFVVAVPSFQLTTPQTLN